VNVVTYAQAAVWVPALNMPLDVTSR